MFSKLFMPVTQVKPVRANDYDAGWLVVTESPIVSFIDECWRYGLNVAIHNLRLQMK
jgi:hypothetical protein